MVFCVTRSVWLQVTVDVTPNGRGDAVLHTAEHGDVFAQPEERRMTFAAFVAMLHAKRKGEIPYLRCSQVNPL